MSVDTAVNQPITIDETAVKAETERLIQKAAERNGLPVDAIRSQVQEEAVAQARANLEQSAKDESNPYKAMYEQERKQREIAENTLQSIRSNHVKASSDTRPVVTAAQARAGTLEWNHRMTVNQKIAALGVEPASVNLKEVARISRGADPKLGSDLHKSDPGRYRTLREVAIVSGVYGA